MRLLSNFEMYIKTLNPKPQMDTDNASLRPKPPPLQSVREKLAKIDAELLQCRQRMDDLRLVASLKAVEEN